MLQPGQYVIVTKNYSMNGKKLKGKIGLVSDTIRAWNDSCWVQFLDDIGENANIRYEGGKQITNCWWCKKIYLEPLPNNHPLIRKVIFKNKIKELLK